MHSQNMKACEITKWLDKKYPCSAAENWDNVGLLVGDDTREIHHIFLALDLTESVLEQALQVNADMIITHHPMIFSGIKKINNHDFTGRKILKLIENKITYYAMHTNFDILGMADLSAEYLNLQNTTVLSVTEVNEAGEQGLGRTGELLETMTLREFGEYVKKCNNINDVRVYGDLSRKVKKVAICTGSGKSMIRDAMAAGADVYVTGDIDHHTAIDTVAQGMALVDAGHYGTEYIFSKKMKEVLKEEFPELLITCERVESPYTVL